MAEREVSTESCFLLNRIIDDEIHKVNDDMKHHLYWQKMDKDPEMISIRQQHIDADKVKIEKYKKALSELENCGCLMTLKP